MYVCGSKYIKHHSYASDFQQQPWVHQIFALVKYQRKQLLALQNYCLQLTETVIILQYFVVLILDNQYCTSVNLLNRCLNFQDWIIGLLSMSTKKSLQSEVCVIYVCWFLV